MLINDASCCWHSLELRFCTVAARCEDDSFLLTVGALPSVRQIVGLRQSYYTTCATTGVPIQITLALFSLMNLLRVRYTSRAAWFSS